MRVAAAVALAALALAAPAAAIGGPATITVTESEVERGTIDVGARGASVGDMLVTRALLYNRRITKRAIGHSETVCIATGSTSSTCTATYFLPKGKIVAIGSIRFSQIFEAAVVGGTGLYDGARGTLTVTALASKPRRSLLVFRLD